MTISLNTPIAKLHEHGIANLSSGMSQKLAAAVAILVAKSDVNAATIGDLLNYFPTRYEDRSNFIGIDKLYDGLEASVEIYTRVAGGFRVGKNRRPRQPQLYIYEISGSDRERTRKPVVVFWFISGKASQSIISYYNQRFKRGSRFAAYGRWEWDGRRNTFALKLNKPDELEMLSSLDESEPLAFSEAAATSEKISGENDSELLEDIDHPEFAMVHTGRCVPIYRKLGPFQTKRLREIIFAVLKEMDRSSIAENLPSDLIKRQKLIPRQLAIEEIHFPPENAAIFDYERFQSPAQTRLIFDEFFWLSFALQLTRGERKKEPKGSIIEISSSMTNGIQSLLPFKLTGAQDRVIQRIFADMTSGEPMNRLIQGDVGSGKTIIAFLAMFAAMENGYQTALMAPTEILAEQHARNARKLFDNTNYRISLLTGSLKAAERRKVLADIESGETQAIIGTHAIIQDGVTFDKLGFAVIDEQHRFGVLQRSHRGPGRTAIGHLRDPS